MADSAADSALDLPDIKFGITNCNFQHQINHSVLSTWQYFWKYFI